MRAIQLKSTEGSGRIHANPRDAAGAKIDQTWNARGDAPSEPIAEFQP